LGTPAQQLISVATHFVISAHGLKDLIYFHVAIKHLVHMVASQAKAEHLLYIYRHTNYCSGGGEYQQRSIKNSKIYLFT
jgi:hypothetical protein